MKKSWNYKEFFKINKKIGKNETFDFVMYFCSSWLIYAVAVVSIFWAYFEYENSISFWFFILNLGFAVFVGLALSLAIAIVWPKKRPVVVLKNVKSIITPFQTWKSFPSDHTLIAFLLALAPLYFGAGFWFVLTLFLFSAMVGYGRIYVGVHYPYDVLGGFLLSLIISPLSFYLVLIFVF